MQRQPRLVDALLTDAQKELYLTSAHFRHAIEALSGMLPAMVDGIAAQALERDQDALERTRMLERAMPGPFLLTLHPKDRP